MSLNSPPAGTTARQRSLDAELATEAAATRSTAENHRHACELHTEAARWQRKVGRDRRSGLHEAYAKTHAQLAARLDDDEA